MAKQEERRDALKIIGTIGATCLFPFEADELYGQHAATHGETPVASASAAPVYEPKALTAAEYALVSQVAELIIPKTDTAGAIEAGVPAYIDFVAGRNSAVLETLREGLGWLAKKKFLTLTAVKQDEVLRQLCQAAEKAERSGKRGKKGGREQFWDTVKNLTADGYYTSRVGMREELGYKGNTAMGEFPGGCEVAEH